MLEKLGARQKSNPFPSAVGHVLGIAQTPSPWCRMLVCPRHALKKKGFFNQHHMVPCKVVIVVVLVVAVAEVALVGHGLMRTTTCRKGLEIYRIGWPLSKKLMARVYSLAMGLNCGTILRLFRSPWRWFPPALCPGV